jgi:uncharacterized membrane protein (UPF0127 family)
VAAVVLWGCVTPFEAHPPSVSSTVVTNHSTVDTGDLVAPDVRAVTVDGRRLLVAWADTGDSRSRGLMDVEDLGELDGMVFDLEREQIPRFTMRNTLIALDIVFFAADGTGVGKLEMVPCLEEPCPTYTIDRPARYALEAPKGTLPLEPDSRLDLSGFAS